MKIVWLVFCLFILPVTMIFWGHGPFSSSSVSTEPADYTLKCSYVGEGTFQRCENNEVICYTSHVYEGDSLSCFEKKAK